MKSKIELLLWMRAVVRERTQMMCLIQRGCYLWPVEYRGLDSKLDKLSVPVQDMKQNMAGKEE